MKYYRFMDEQFLHYMNPEEARVLVETQFLLSLPEARKSARAYFNFYKRDVTDDYLRAYCMDQEIIPHVHEFLRNCLLLLGFTGFQVVEQDAPVCEISARNDVGQWIPYEEDMQLRMEH